MRTKLLSICSEIHKMFDVLSVYDNQNEITLELSPPTPLRLLTLFSEHGLYRMRVCVRGDNGAKSQTLPIEMDWRGSMEGLTARVSSAKT